MTLKEIVEQLRMCGYVCEAGPLENNVAFIELMKMALAESEERLGQIEDLIKKVEDALVYDERKSPDTASIIRTKAGEIVMVVCD